MFFLMLKIFFLLFLTAVFSALLTWFFLRRQYEDVTESSRYFNELDARLANIDSRLASMGSGGGSGSVDLTSVTSGIAALSSTVGALKSGTDLGPVLARIGELEAKVDGMKSPKCSCDLSGVESHLTKLEGLISAGSMAVAAPSAPPVYDNLTKVEGIGPKIKELFWKDGITSFADLAGASVERLQGVLDAAGKRYKVHNPATWPEQAAFCRDDKWDELKAWQNELKSGR